MRMAPSCWRQRLPGLAGSMRGWVCSPLSGDLDWRHRALLVGLRFWAALAALALALPDTGETGKGGDLVCWTWADHPRYEPLYSRQPPATVPGGGHTAILRAIFCSDNRHLLSAVGDRHSCDRALRSQTSLWLCGGSSLASRGGRALWPLATPPGRGPNLAVGWHRLSEVPALGVLVGLALLSARGGPVRLAWPGLPSIAPCIPSGSWCTLSTVPTGIWTDRRRL